MSAVRGEDAMQDSFLPLFYDWLEVTEPLNDAEKGRLIDVYVLYGRGDGGWQDRIKGNERYLVPMFLAQLRRSRELRAAKAAVDRENGKLGGRPRKKPQGAEGNPPFAEKTQNIEKDNPEDNPEDEAEDPGSPEEEEDRRDHTPQGAAGAVVSAWRHCYGKTPNPTIVRTVLYWSRMCRCEDEAMVREAISAAAARDASDPVAYVIALFKDWNTRGIHSAEELE